MTWTENVEKTLFWLDTIRREVKDFMEDGQPLKNTEKTCEEAANIIRALIKRGRDRNRCPFCGNPEIEFQFWIPKGAEFGFYYGSCNLCGARIRYKEEDLNNDTLEENVPGEV